MRIRVVAMSDRDVFVGINAESDYCVFTRDDTAEIEIGDIINGPFEQDGFAWVKNITKDERVYICVESWGCTQATAFDFLRRLGSPTKIFTA